MKIEVRGSEFNISFVNNWCREKYQDMMFKIDEMNELPQEAEAVREDDNLSTADKLQKNREIRKKQRQLIKDIATIREEILEEILTTNKYEYDRKWWMHKTDVEDVNRFVLDCLQKDLSEQQNKSKKK